MKNKIFIIAMLLFLCSLSLIFIEEAKDKSRVCERKYTHSELLQTTNSWLEKFCIGAVHDGIDCKNNYSNLKSLGFNLFHLYVLNHEFDAINKKYYPKMYWGDCGDIQNDILRTTDAEYAFDVNKIISDIHKQIPEMRIVMMRPVIEYLCRGQRSDYQCENIPATESLWFYAFNDHNTGVTITDNSNFGGDNIKVVHCRTMPSNKANDPAGFVVKRLRANTEQCNSIKGPGGNEWQGDSFSKWKIKPRIRIDPNFAHKNKNSPVCKITVIHQDGITVLMDVILKAKNFIDTNEQYNGAYIEEYNFENDSADLTLSGEWGDNWGYSARDLRPNDGVSNINRADIQVYWYGNCDMWIDYVRVDDDIADRLLKEPDGDEEFNKWIENEIKKIGMNSVSGEIIFMKYYLETLEFNHLNCAAFVNNKLKYYSDGKIDLIQDLTNTISMHVSWDNRTRIENPHFLKKYYIDKVGYTQIFTESYPLTACYTKTQDQQKFSRLPNTLGDNLLNNPYVLAQLINPDDYDILLQDNINHRPYVLESGYKDEDPICNNSILRQDRGNFRYRLELGDSLSKLADIPFIFMPQTHQWFRQLEVRREPTNEELNMMINTSLCYGVKGILYFAYNSEPEYSNGWYGTGIADENGNLRMHNFYGQTNPDKIQTLKDISERVAGKWGPYLIKFDNAGRFTSILDSGTQRRNFLNNSYFSEIRTYPPSQAVMQKESSSPDELKFTYVQAAVFKNPAEKDVRYFMIVNRRCSPFDNGKNQNGGRRKIKIKFDIDSPAFTGSEMWKIVDLYNDTDIAVFDKNSDLQIDIGWFLPGEGKLYKIIPANK